MGHVTVTINSRTYRLRCGDGEEQRLVALANQVKARVDRLLSEFGNVGDDRILLMAALLIADELMDARMMLDELTAPEAPAPVLQQRTA
jgi:cell division protein ZapA